MIENELSVVGTINLSSKGRNLFLQVLQRVLREPSGVLGAAIILLLIVVAILAPYISPYDPNDQIAKRLQAPNPQYILGTDEFGRDILSRLIFGARVSLLVGVVAVMIALIIGGPLGLLSGYWMGTFDSVVQRLVDIMLAIPNIILLIAIAGVVGPGLTTAMISIGIVYSPAYTRVIRGPTLSVVHEQYVEAARACGVKPLRIMFKHVLPNVLAPIIVQATLSFSTAILAEATISFLGLGIQPPDPSWGVMLANGRKFLELAPWLTILPGAAIMITVLGFNLLGDSLRDALDPRLRHR
ncbi:MAG: ABC transporter permease [Anaerolineaceae bacterium]|nr:ABC transporter permease [Anaerolineaceae bacterium]